MPTLAEKGAEMTLTEFPRCFWSRRGKQPEGQRRCYNCPWPGHEWRHCPRGDRRYTVSPRFAGGQGQRSQGPADASSWRRTSLTGLERSAPEVVAKRGGIVEDCRLHTPVLTPMPPGGALPTAGSCPDFQQGITDLVVFIHSPAGYLGGRWESLEYRPRVNVTFLENGTKVAALSPKTFVFQPDMSAGDPEIDQVTTVNIPAVTVMELTKSSFTSLVIFFMMNVYGVEVFATHTVHELLWGFKDPLLSKLHYVKPEVDEYFGLMYKKNGTSDGDFVFKSGEDDYKDFGKIFTWNGQSTLKWWSSNESNMINGTDGSTFHPLISKDELLYIFAADLCRSYINSKTAHMHDGKDAVGGHFMGEEPEVEECWEGTVGKDGIDDIRNNGGGRAEVTCCGKNEAYGGGASFFL
ncbi:SCRB2 protein, partial [Polypterus senegalus]